jgi:ABC-type multidrug transport system fused ATPase/permease subunit/GT2 family glycosyltransferase
MYNRVSVDGKFFARAGQRFAFRGVTYGTFRPRPDGERFPRTEQIAADAAQIAAAGFTVARTYTAPPEDVMARFDDVGVRVLAGVHYADWRYLIGSSRRQLRRIVGDARREVREAAERFAGDHRVVALSLGNEVPADVLRWLGTGVIADTISELADVVHDADPGQLVTYANYPTAEYLPLDSLDFLTFNVFLEEHGDLRRYLNRLHHLAGDRPLVLGEFGLDSGNTPEGEARQAAVLDRQFDTAIDRGVAGTCVFSYTDEWWVGDSAVEGWHFGLTRADRTPRPAWDVAAKWNKISVKELDRDWPSISVVICAYNEAETIDECLRHTCALDYPNLEVIVCDDGSTDDTAALAGRHPRAKVVTLPHGGLSVARNEGYRIATGELVAYLDSDAYPSPEWPYFLALGLDAPDVGGVGGPNVPPLDDPPGAHVVARSPGGPVHVLLSDDRAEHIPGCNMAFWKGVLTEVGGCDPIYTAAGDDVDLCWRVRDRDWEIGFHPAALVWHHRRAGLKKYLKQQRGYGRAEALVEARHPDRFTPVGTARWRGRIYNSSTSPAGRQRVYRGTYGTAAYQSVYHAATDFTDILHQAGVPLALLALLTLPLALISPWLALPAALGLLTLTSLAVTDVVRAEPPRRGAPRRRFFRGWVALHHLMQPVVRAWGHHRHRSGALKGLTHRSELPPRVRTIRHGGVVVPDEQPRADLASATIDELRRRGQRVVTSNGWDDYDARLLLSRTMYGDLQTSCHPVGWVQIRLRRRLRARPILVAAGIAGVLTYLANPLFALLPAAWTLFSLSRGEWRARYLLQSTFPRNRFGGAAPIAPAHVPVIADKTVPAPSQPTASRAVDAPAFFVSSDANSDGNGHAAGNGHSGGTRQRVGSRSDDELLAASTADDIDDPELDVDPNPDSSPESSDGDADETTDSDNATARLAGRVSDTVEKEAAGSGHHYEYVQGNALVKGWKLLPRCFPYLRPYRKEAITLVFSTIMLALLALAAPWPLAFIVDSVLGGKNSAPDWVTTLVGSSPGRLILFGAIASIGLTLLVSAITIGDDFVSTRMNLGMILDFRSDMFKKAQALPLAYHEETMSGFTLYRINQQAGAIGPIITNLPALAQSLLTVAGMVYISVRIDVGLALLALAVVPVIAYSTHYYAKKVEPDLLKVRGMEGFNLSIVHEAMSMLKVIIAFGREDHEYTRFRSQGEETVKYRVKVTVRQTVFSLVVGLFTVAGTAGVIYLGAHRVLRGDLSVGQLLVILAYIAAVYSPLQSLTSTLTGYQGLFIELDHALELVDHPVAIQSKPGAVELDRARGDIRFHDVRFGYETRPDVIKGVSFHVPAGRSIAIVGATGAGKSTLVSLLPRFYEVQDGQVLVDGHRVDDLTLESLRSQFALVLQEPLLFTGTIYENIAYGKPGATQEEVIAAAQAANAHDFIMRLPQGYSTRLGERGAKVSGGERQRISVARAFLRDAPILILDEPTSSIDSRTEEVILDALDKLMVGRTTVMIAHRLSTVRHVDEILVLADGEIVQRGTHDELVSEPGMYQHMWETQTRQRRRRHAVRPGEPILTLDPGSPS